MRGPSILLGACALAFLIISRTHVAGAGGQEAAGPATPEQTTGPVAAQDPSYPPFTVASRTEAIASTGFYPCTICHSAGIVEPNPAIRELTMHGEKVLDHGNGAFWCLTCHNEGDRDSLVNLKAERVSFDESYMLCAQCHSERANDFLFGGHGKRLDTWNGERVLTMCVECHDPHSPAIPARMPVPPPQLRPGLPPPLPYEPREKPWEVIRESRGLPAEEGQPADDTENVVP